MGRDGRELVSGGVLRSFLGRFWALALLGLF
jgi:hypothetical protein